MVAQKVSDSFCSVYSLLKVRQFQNEFIKSSFLSKYEQKFVKISALTTKGINPYNLSSVLNNEKQYLSFFTNFYRRKFNQESILTAPHWHFTLEKVFRPKVCQTNSTIEIAHALSGLETCRKQKLKQMN